MMQRIFSKLSKLLAYSRCIRNDNKEEDCVILLKDATKFKNNNLPSAEWLKNSVEASSNRLDPFVTILNVSLNGSCSTDNLTHDCDLEKVTNIDFQFNQNRIVNINDSSLVNVNFLKYLCFIISIELSNDLFNLNTILTNNNLSCDNFNEKIYYPKLLAIMMKSILYKMKTNQLPYNILEMLNNLIELKTPENDIEAFETGLLFLNLNCSFLKIYKYGVGLIIRDENNLKFYCPYNLWLRSGDRIAYSKKLTRVFYDTLNFNTSDVSEWNVLQMEVLVGNMTSPYDTKKLYKDRLMDIQRGNVFFTEIINDGIRIKVNRAEEYV